MFPRRNIVNWIKSIEKTILYIPCEMSAFFQFFENIPEDLFTSKLRHVFSRLSMTVLRNCAESRASGPRASGASTASFVIRSRRAPAISRRPRGPTRGGTLYIPLILSRYMVSLVLSSRVYLSGKLRTRKKNGGGGGGVAYQQGGGGGNKGMGASPACVIRRMTCVAVYSSVLLSHAMYLQLRSSSHHALVQKFIFYVFLPVTSFSLILSTSTPRPSTVLQHHQSTGFQTYIFEINLEHISCDEF